MRAAFAQLSWAIGQWMAADKRREAKLAQAEGEAPPSIEQEIIEFTEEPGLYALGRMHERARGEVDSKGKQTQKGKEDQQRVEALARGRRDEFLKESYFPKVRPSTIMHL